MPNELDRRVEDTMKKLALSKEQLTIELIYEELVHMRSLQEMNAVKLGKMAEILEAWDNAKGFVKTVKMIVGTAKWLLIAGGTATALYYWITGRGHL